jgi:signal transduction histidine kinase
MPARSSPSALAGAVLALVGDGVTASELVGRFAANDADLDQQTATARLDELCELGLARAARTVGATTYFLTPLGQRTLEASFVADPDHAGRLAEVERMRTELLSTIAHELRTPLTAVRTSVGLLLDPAVEPSEDQRRTLLLAIDRNATRMQRVVGDILDIERLRAGRLQLQRRRFDARDLAASAISSVAPVAESRRQTIALDLPPEPVHVFADFGRLEQALVNLLSNAEKYSPEGAPITVTVAERGGEVSWSVTDLGPGIDPEDQARLFERFFVAGGDRRGAAAGVGLGLPISLLIVQAHGGRIDVSSQPGRGSTFTIRVPAAGLDEAARE